MRIIIVEGGKRPYEAELEHDLESMRRCVGGDIEAVYEPGGRDAAMICNDEGKLLGLPWNRTLTDDHGVPYDIVCGTFFVAGLKEDDFASLTEQQIEKYRKKYANEMVFSVPVPSGNHKKQCNKEKNEHER